MTDNRSLGTAASTEVSPERHGKKNQHTANAARRAETALGSREPRALPGGPSAAPAAADPRRRGGPPRLRPSPPEETPPGAPLRNEQGTAAGSRLPPRRRPRGRGSRQPPAPLTSPRPEPHACPPGGNTPLLRHPFPPEEASRAAPLRWGRRLDAPVSPQPAAPGRSPGLKSTVPLR